MSEFPPWRLPLARALNLNCSLPHLKFVQLATVDLQGRPHNRTIVYRGLIDDSHKLKFITDSRSEKVTHLGYQPWVEVCWYFTKTREQFRFAGLMGIVSGHFLKTAHPTTAEHDLRVSTWQALSENARQQFFWPNPGEMRSQNSSFDSVQTSPLPPSNFALLLLEVTQVEHLQLRANPQNRDRYIRNYDQNWSVESLNP